jgi:type II secretory pathway pseudopilin PulG
MTQPLLRLRVALADAASPVGAPASEHGARPLPESSALARGSAISPPCRSRRAGRRAVTLIELLITLSLLLLLTGTASVYYMQSLESRKEGKAKTELVQFEKALKTFMERMGWPDALRPPFDNPRWRGRFYIRDFSPLYEMKIMLRDPNNPPPDPWGHEYWVDVPRGVVGCAGPDGKEGSGDDIEIRFRPVFEVQRARYDARTNAIVLDFTRPVDKTTATTQAIKVEGQGISPPTTTVLEPDNPFRIRLPLKARPPGQATATVKLVTSTDPLTQKEVSSIKALDTTTLGAIGELKTTFDVTLAGP